MNPISTSRGHDGRQRILAVLVVAEVIAIVLLLLFRDCCTVPSALARMEAAPGEIVLVQDPTDVGPNPFIDIDDRQKDGTVGSIAMTTDPETGLDVGTYGGTKENTCNPELLVKFLTEIDTDKGKAWATAQGIAFADIAAFVAGLTPSVLAKDTYITNFGYKGGLTSNPSMLKKGTAVLVDANGVPRVRCMCGNPMIVVNLPPPPECVGTVEVFGFFDGEPTLFSEGQFDVKTLTFGPSTAGALVFYGQLLVNLPGGGEGLVDPDEWAALGDLCKFPPISACTATDVPDDGAGGVIFGPGTPVDIVVIPFASQPGVPLFALVGANNVTSQYFDLATLQTLISSGPCEQSRTCTLALETTLVFESDGVETVTLAAGTEVTVLWLGFLSSPPIAYITWDGTPNEGSIPLSSLGEDCVVEQETTACSGSAEVLTWTNGGEVHLPIPPNTELTVSGPVLQMFDDTQVKVTWTVNGVTEFGWVPASAIGNYGPCEPSDGCTVITKAPIYEYVQGAPGALTGHVSPGEVYDPVAWVQFGDEILLEVVIGGSSYLIPFAAMEPGCFEVRACLVDRVEVVDIDPVGGQLPIPPTPIFLQGPSKTVGNQVLHQAVWQDVNGVVTSGWLPLGGHLATEGCDVPPPTTTTVPPTTVPRTTAPPQECRYAERAPIYDEPNLNGNVIGFGTGGTFTPIPGPIEFGPSGGTFILIDQGGTQGWAEFTYFSGDCAYLFGG